MHVATAVDASDTEVCHRSITEPEHFAVMELQGQTQTALMESSTIEHYPKAGITV